MTIHFFFFNNDIVNTVYILRVVDAIEEKQTPLEELLKMKVFPKYYPPKPKPVEPITITAMVNESVEISVLK